MCQPLANRSSCCYYIIGYCSFFPFAGITRTMRAPLFGSSGGSKGGGGAQQVCHPPKIGSTMFFVIQFLIKMLKNKAPIALETIKTTPELPGPLSRPWTPAESEFGSALVMSMLAHSLLRPPKWKSWIRPWAGTRTWHFKALRKSPWKLIILMNDLLSHCTLLAYYIRQNVKGLSQFF